jgi:lycopene beta-cyclase
LVNIMLNLPTRSAEQRPIVILGAGLAGLSLADALLDARTTRPLVLIDRRRAWEQDRTWCTWATGPLRHLPLSRHRWWSWQTVSGGRTARAVTDTHPYVHLDAAAVYSSVLDRLAAHPGAEVRAGERVIAVDSAARWPQVTTSRETFDAELVIDAMGPASPLRHRPETASIDMSQRFLGWELEVDRPIFDPLTVTLMDFVAPGPDGCNFIYVLPFSPTRALVEHTSIGLAGPGPRERRDALRAWLTQHGAREWEIEREERGAIPMTSSPFPLDHGPRVHTVGAAAGAIRPSSGYAFTRIQGHVERLARALTGGGELPRSIAPARYAVLDQIFLTALAGADDHGEALFASIAHRVDADAFARFMTDASSPADEARIIAALPPLPMVRAGIRTLARDGRAG